MIISLLLPFFVLFNAASCTLDFSIQEEKSSFTFVEGYNFPYKFDQPSTVLKLPDKLVEVSGLTLVNNETKLGVVQDEEGVIFILDKETGKIDYEFPFHAQGDYEGIEMVGDDFFVVKSKGDIFQIRGLGTDQQKVRIHETFLNKTANVEGLGYDPDNHRLLLACKGKFTGGKEDNSFSRAIYGFDLKTNKLLETPVFVIDLELLNSYLNSGEPVKYLEKINDKIDPKNGGFIFGPSGIAVHPKTKNIYLISSVGKMLMVVSPSGKIIHIEKFNKKLHSQPEGICFEKDGTMWIANEANESVPTLVKYSMR